MGFTFLIYGSVGFFSGSIGEWLRRKPALSSRFHWVTAIVFIGLGITALLPTH
jgi:threonine/homoserine/homoserine lactone efflux protein